jgi:hypothetical protein
MRSLPVHVLAIAAVLAGACARGQSDYVGEPGSGVPTVGPQGGNGGGNGNGAGNNGTGNGTGGADGGGTGVATDGGGVVTDGGGTAHDAAPPQDATTGTDAAPPFPDAGSLDPLLSLPDPSGVACVPSGFGSEVGCPAFNVCRLASPTGGRCETCTDCGNRGATCSTGKDCDILFECYDGRCTNFCQLGTYNCGPIADCLNVGHPTIGVCRL